VAQEPTCRECRCGVLIGGDTGEEVAGNGCLTLVLLRAFGFGVWIGLGGAAGGFRSDILLGPEGTSVTSVGVGFVFSVTRPILFSKLPRVGCVLAGGLGLVVV